MRLIDADKIEWTGYEGDVGQFAFKKQIDEMPTVEPIKNGNCIDCSFYECEDEVNCCGIWQVFGEKASPPENGFCHCYKKKG